MQNNSGDIFRIRSLDFITWTSYSDIDKIKISCLNVIIQVHVFPLFFYGLYFDLILLNWSHNFLFKYLLIMQKTVLILV